MVDGYCDVCIAELGTELYSEHLDNAQDVFFVENCIKTEDSEVEEAVVEAITRGVVQAMYADKTIAQYTADYRNEDRDGDIIYPMSVGCLESCPCSVCGRWSTGLCCN